MIYMKKATLNDLKSVVSIGRETYSEAFSSQNKPEIMAAYLREAFSEQVVMQWLGKTTIFTYLVIRESDGGIVGYLKLNLSPDQSDFNEKNSLEVERIYLRSSEKGKGYGKQMISFAEAVADDHKCLNLWLGVWEKNESAVMFYKRMGFDIVGKHPFVMDHEIQTDYVMKKSMKGSV